MFIDPTRDGITQITESLAGRSGIDAIHIVSHGRDGEVQLGNTTLSQETLAAHADQIANWSSSLDADADLLFYGCDLAATETGEDLIQSIAELTDADVAASDDLTGHADLGGDWDFEYFVGDVQTDVAFSVTAQANWHHTLATFTVTTSDDVIDETDGQLSLREAIIAANNTSGADQIVVGEGTFSLALSGADEDLAATGDLDITEDVTIVGLDQLTTIIDANGLDRVFDVQSGDLTVRKPDRHGWFRRCSGRVEVFASMEGRSPQSTSRSPETAVRPVAESAF